MPDRMVIGKVVSLEHGRPVVMSPLGPMPSNSTRVARLIEAARKFQRDQTHETSVALLEAALEID